MNYIICRFINQSIHFKERKKAGQEGTRRRYTWYDNFFFKLYIKINIYLFYLGEKDKIL